MHEAQMHNGNNSFLTLTYSDEHLPKNNSLDHSHFQDFMKRLRDAVPEKIRFYMCGEYGSAEYTRRPHFHAILFNLTFPDQELWKMSNGLPIHTSKFLSTKWTKGNAFIGSVTFKSAAYVARYVMKKATADDSDIVYDPHDPVSGELLLPAKLVPEYNKASTSGDSRGLGHDWLKKYHTDVYPSDEIIVRGYAMRPPAYYDKLYKSWYPELFEKILTQRAKTGREHAENSTSARLKIREIIKTEKVKRLTRNKESFQ